ncbi:TMhelix containing protein [Vibrio phage 1.149.O._10N.286.55.A12]|nr:TMhelix containing protein [Vibrio phage 1.149.O._10N.286.55.A12]AUR93271.1 TMhelix containing protein [Vibrio phage 1.186.O._10N.286.49.E3]
MNEQLQGAVAQILERAISGIDSSVDFMQAELPEAIEQLLLWYGVRSALMCLISVAIMVVIPIVWRCWVKKCKADDGYHDEFDMYMIPAIISIAPSAFALINVNLEWLQIWIAPKIWLMEYAANLVK